jgi:surface polysaccharide O-acyltransferase-like enzyme
MPLAAPIPDPRKVVNNTPPGRDRAVDVARLAALMVVIFGHCAVVLVTIVSGRIRVGVVLAEIPALAPVSWLCQVMPLFFLAGGAAGAYGWRDDTPLGGWLFTRAQRLCRPVFWYLAAWVVALAVVRMILGEAFAAGLRRRCLVTLWFVGLYLVLLAFVPVLTRLRAGRAVAIVVASLLVGAFAVDWIRSVGTPQVGIANLLIVWLIPVVIGVAYARRLIGPRAALAAAASTFALQVVLAVAGTYEMSVVGTGAERMSNVWPPTLLLALQCTWMSCLFVAAAGAIRRWAARPRVWGIVAAGNAGAMTLYLWHFPAIVVVVFSLRAAGLGAYDVHAPGFWGLLVLRVVVFAAVMAVVFRLLSPLEHRRLPWWDEPTRASGAPSTAAGALVCVAGVAVFLLAVFGLSGFAGWTLLGCFLAAAVAARVSAGWVTRSRKGALR